MELRLSVSAIGLCVPLVFAIGCGPRAPSRPPLPLAAEEQSYLQAPAQITTVGRRAGEGYFSADGQTIVFQSEAEEGNPFYQIYTHNLRTGETTRVSPGHGKTTCAWIHPTGDKVLFASTHLDPKTPEKTQHELAVRAEGKARRYQWDYDEHFDIFEATPDGTSLKNLTNALGYDAEGSYSPDGQWIAFASNREVYARRRSAAEDAQLARDPSYFMDLYLMRADGSGLKRLTTAPGYDGGPFFSADGKRLVWRRFARDGRSAEIYTMNVDGSKQKQLTHMGALSWAPYFHPSGDYVIFSSNPAGHHNFELFVVDSAGKQKPVQVTWTMGFDGLPVFAPDGGKLLWTSGRTADKSSQLVLAEWSDAQARAALRLAPPG